MVWTFREIITAKTEKEARVKFKKILESEHDVKRGQFKVTSCSNTRQYPETWEVWYQARKKPRRRLK